MKLITPIEMTNDQLVSSSLSEDDHDEWAVGTTYDAEDRVIVTGTTDKVYESVQGSNTGNNPVTDDGTWWVEISATNRWKAFDKKVLDQATGDAPLSYVIQPNTLVQGIAILNPRASILNIKIDDLSDTEVYNKTFDLAGADEIVDWLSFFTVDLDYKDSLVVDGVPAFPEYKITLTFGQFGENASVGEIALGRITDLGRLISGSSSGIQDFSEKTRDDFGNATITERASIDEITYLFEIPAKSQPKVKRALTRLRATPVVYFGGYGQNALGTTVYGFFRDFDIPIVGAWDATVRLEVEGLT